MFAIIKAGGKQYKVQAGDELLIERQGSAKAKTLKLDQVLLLSKGASVEVGRPFVKGAYCEADVLEETRIERETLQGGYICFKAFRRDTEVHLSEKDLAALHVRRMDSDVKGVKTETTVSRWVFVSISCVKQ